MSGCSDTNTTEWVGATSGTGPPPTFHANVGEGAEAAVGLYWSQQMNFPTDTRPLYDNVQAVAPDTTGSGASEDISYDSGTGLLESSEPLNWSP